MKGTSISALRRNTGSDGFTLIELLVVLVIMSVLSTMIVPSVVSALRRNNLGDTGGKLSELLDYARLSAITQRRTVVVNLDPEKNRCWVSASSMSLPWLDGGDEDKERFLADLVLPPGTSLRVNRTSEGALEASTATSWETLTFRSNGTAEDAVIELTNAEGEGYAIEITGVTGSVTGGEVRP